MKGPELLLLGQSLGFLDDLLLDVAGGFMVVMPSSAGMEPIMVPRRLELMSPMMAPWNSSGMVTNSWRAWP